MASRADVIERILVEGVNSVDELFDRVRVERPEDNVARIKAQYSTILREVSKGQKRWAKYKIENNGLKLVLNE